jgi:lipopolysaccharide transport system permease protein
MIKENIRELYRFRELLWVWTFREIRARYKQSILGGTWAILQPFSLMLIFTVVFSYLAEIPSDGIPYPVFSYSALLPWTFFATSVSFSVNSLIGNMNLVTKIYFPREVLPFASIGAAFLDYLIASSIFMLLMLYYQVPVHPTLLYLPLLLLVQITLTAGVSLLVASIVVFFRDLRFVVPLGLQLWMYATPIVYPLSLVPERFQSIYMLNPMASLIDGYRRITLLGQAPQWEYLVIGMLITITLLCVAYIFFKKAESVFADII